MELDLLKAGTSPLKDLIDFLYKKSQTNDVQKKQLIMELRNNLNVFKNALINTPEIDSMIDLMNNDAIQEAINNNYRFNKLKQGCIEPYHVNDDRNKKYIGWTAEKLVEKIDEKIIEIKNIKKMNNGTVKNAKTNVSLMMSNLYFRMKLLADFIQSDSEGHSTVVEDPDE